MNDSEPKYRSWDNFKPSIVSQRTANPIRNVMEKINLKSANPNKALIQLSIGDPTVYGNLKLASHVKEELIKNIQIEKNNGYTHSCGAPEARQALMKKYEVDEMEDVIIASGASGALDLAISALADEGDNILLPKPGFSLYQTLALSKGIEVRFYDLDPKNKWEVKLDSLQSVIDEKTKAIVVNNPSNPCGSVYRKEHLLEILKVAEDNNLPIIADEIYETLCFGTNRFYSLYSLSKTVPILTIGGLAKIYLVPGWRIGWVIVHDRQDIFKKVNLRRALFQLSTLIVGGNTLVQSVVPSFLNDTPIEYYKDLINTLTANANFAMERIQVIPGLRIIEPQGAMYLMVQILVDQFDDTIQDDLSFVQALVKEESVTVLPGSCFQIPNYFRVVFCAPHDTLKTALDRLDAFCKHHLEQ